MINFEKLERELLTYKLFLSSNNTDNKLDLNKITNIVEFFVNKNLSIDYTQLTYLIRIFLTIPITSVTAECSFSALKRTNTYLRNTINQERLSSISIIHIEKELAQTIEIKNVIDKFGSLQDRRLQFF